MSVRLIALDVPSGPEFVDALRTVWDDGDAALPIDPRLPPPARGALLASLRPAVLVHASGERETLAGAVPLIHGDALVMATSGTTGVPKGVVLTHDAIRSSAVATSARLGVVASEDHWLCCLPLAHVGGLSVVTRALLTGTGLTVLPAFDIDAVVGAQRDGATLVSLVPAALERLATADASAVQAWRRILLGGSAMPTSPPPNAVKSYGMTETGSGIVYDGLPLDGVEIRVEHGQVLVRCPMLLRAYRTIGTDGALTPEGIDPCGPDGWFATGDAAHLDTNGRLVVEGRVGDVIVTGGEKVWPEPVERVLANALGVADVAVGGRRDAAWGSRVVAFVVPSDSAAPPTLDALRDHVKTVLPAYAAPHELVFVDRIPRTAIGKIQRAALI